MPALGAVTTATIINPTTFGNAVVNAVNSIIPNGNVPRVRVTNGAAVAIAAVTTTDVTFNTESFDTDAMHSTSSNTDRLTVPSGLGGVWFFGYNVQFAAAAAAGDRQAWVTNSATGGVRYGSSLITTQTAGQNATLCGAGFLVLAAGDYLQLKVYSAQAINVNPVGVDYFEMCRLGPS